MCQENCRSLTTEVQQRLQATGQIVGYKVLKKNLESPFRLYKWQLGENTAHVKVPKEWKEEEHSGIHVFLNKGAALMYHIQDKEIVIQVVCKAEDFVSAGYLDGMPTAVFQTVTVESFDPVS